MNENNYKYGDRVKYNIDSNFIGTGRIVGKAITHLAVIGGTYIIEPDVSIRSEHYDYTHFVANETMLEKLSDK